MNEKKSRAPQIVNVEPVAPKALFTVDRFGNIREDSAYMSPERVARLLNGYRQEIAKLRRTVDNAT